MDVGTDEVGVGEGGLVCSGTVGEGVGQTKGLVEDDDTPDSSHATAVIANTVTAMPIRPLTALPGRFLAFPPCRLSPPGAILPSLAALSKRCRPGRSREEPPEWPRPREAHSALRLFVANRSATRPSIRGA